MFAANHNFEDMVKLMLVHGANPLSRSHHGHTARGCAATMNHIHIIELLNDYSAEHVLRVQQLQQQHSDKSQQLPHEYLYDKFRNYQIFSSSATTPIPIPTSVSSHGPKIVEPTVPFNPHRNLEAFRNLPDIEEEGGSFLEW